MKKKRSNGVDAERLDERGAALAQARLQSIEIAERVKDCHVPSELPFERRHREALHEEDVQLLPAADVEPDGFVRHVRGYGLADVAERLLEKRRRLLDLARGQREMRQAHAFARSV